VLYAQLIEPENLIPFAVFGMFAALAWWAMETIAARSRTLERLEELKEPRKHEPEKRPGKPTDRVTRVLEKATPALAKPLEPKSELEKNNLRIRLANAGFRGESAPSIFLGLKFASLVIGLLLGGAKLLLSHDYSQRNLITVAVIAAFFMYLPDLVVWFRRKRRQDQIFLGLPDALDLMVVCVEAGLGLDQAMRKVAEEMKHSYPVVAEEFGIANFQLQMGRPRPEVLHELGVRTGVTDVRALASVLIQADKFGSSIAQALRVQSDAMRTRRRQLAEERAAKTAVKLIFPLVLFIFPGIFVVLVGPAAITIMREMMPRMTGG